jgi:hypothetical protein
MYLEIYSVVKTLQGKMYDITVQLSSEDGRIILKWIEYALMNKVMKL